MHELAALEEMTEDEVLASATACAQTLQRAEVDLLRVAYQWAVLHDPDRLDPVVSWLPGREKARSYGGPGTSPVTEFAAAQLGARIGRTTHAAASLIGDALDLRHRLPQLWARVEAGEVRASYARHVARATRDLTVAEAAYVDAGVTESADGRIPWTRFEALVEGKVTQAAPQVAREKEERAAKARFAKMLRACDPDKRHGMASFLVRADVATIEAIDAAVTTRAQQLQRTRPEDPDLATDDERRVHAFLLLVTGADDETDTTDLLPTVTLYVHTYASTDHQPDAEPVMRVEGHGPVTDTWVRQVLGPKARFKVQPVLDLAGQAPVDAYEIPERHRQAVHLITPADTFPYGSSTARSMQIDHTIAYDPGGPPGQSSIGNYGPLTQGHHRVKTHGGWQVHQPWPGIYCWRDPHGALYLVDHTGTRPLQPRRPSASRLEAHFTQILIDHQLAA